MAKKSAVAVGNSAPYLGIKALQNWYGSNRTLAHHVGAECRGCSWVGVVFAGGCSELAHIDARTIGVNDRHFHLINLLRVLADPVSGPRLIRHLRRQPFDAGVLADAQRLCGRIEQVERQTVATLFAASLSMSNRMTDDERERWAAAYFITGWMGRGGNAGTIGEFTGGLPLRWDAGGGGSATRYQSAVRSLPAWRRRVLSRCEFTTLDFRDFLIRCKDRDGICIYCDPPFPGPGDRYVHQLHEPGRDPATAHADLARLVNRFRNARVVMRFYRHPLIERLYPTDRWTWREFRGRDTHNNDEKPEVLLINGSSRAAE